MLVAGLLNGDAMMGVRGENRRDKRDDWRQVERNGLEDKIACNEDVSLVSAARCSGKGRSEVWKDPFAKRRSSKEVGDGGKLDSGGGEGVRVCGMEGV